MDTHGIRAVLSQRQHSEQQQQQQQQQQQPLEEGRSSLPSLPPSSSLSSTSTESLFDLNAEAIESVDLFLLVTSTASVLDDLCGEEVGGLVGEKKKMKRFALVLARSHFISTASLFFFFGGGGTS
jgi:hypothetical protein